MNNKLKLDRRIDQTHDRNHNYGTKTTFKNNKAITKNE